MIRQLDIPIYDTNVLFLLETTGEEWAEFCSKKTNKEKLYEEEIKEVSDEISNDARDTIMGMYRKALDISGEVYRAMLVKMRETIDYELKKRKEREQL